jgi:hypothetical protein
MSYSTINKCAQDPSLYGRLCAAAAAEGDVSKAGQVLWPVAASSDIEAAYASALAANNPDPGGDESVITDQMILSAVQAHWPADVPA